MRNILVIALIVFLITPQISISCEIETEAKLFATAFLSGDVNRIAKFYKEGILFSIETDNVEAFTKKTATTEKDFKKILREYLKYQPFRKVPNEIEITKSKIIYGGDNYTSYHHHWSLREISFKCIENDFIVTNIYLIDGM